MFPPLTRAVAAACASFLAPLPCAIALPQSVSPEPRSVAPSPEVPAGGDEAALTLSRALDRALAEGWRELHVETECVTEAGFRAVEVFGNGVGIWNRKTQFQLSRAEVQALLQAFRESDYPNMRESYGGRADPVVREKQPPRATCRVALSLDGARKQVAQLQRGRQSEELKRLASRILGSCEEPARAGRGAASLEDGLARVAAGELAAETFQVILHRKEERKDSNAGSEGWLLRVEGKQASTRRLTPGKGYADPIVLELRREDLAGLAQLLRSEGVDGLPFNLFAEHYTELVVAVLNWRKALQARPFSGMTSTTHGAKQKRFEQIFTRLRDLEHRVGAEGRRVFLGSPVPDPR